MPVIIPVSIYVWTQIICSSTVHAGSLITCTCSFIIASLTPIHTNLCGAVFWESLLKPLGYEGKLGEVLMDGEFQLDQMLQIQFTN